MHEHDRRRVAKRLWRLAEQVDTALERLAQATADAYPVGSRISWQTERQGQVYTHYGQVELHLGITYSRPEFWARNEKTGKRVTIRLWMFPHRED